MTSIETAGIGFRTKPACMLKTKSRNATSVHLPINRVLIDDQPEKYGKKKPVFILYIKFGMPCNEVVANNYAMTKSCDGDSPGYVCWKGCIVPQEGQLSMLYPKQQSILGPILA